MRDDTQEGGRGKSEVPQESSAPACAITMYATRWCGDCRRAKRWFDAHSIPYDAIDIDRDDQAAAYVMQVNGGMLLTREQPRTGATQ